MRIRVEGTEIEIAVAVDRIAAVLAVQEASSFYPNRGASQLGRVYLTVAADSASSGPEGRDGEPVGMPRSEDV